MFVASIRPGVDLRLIEERHAPLLFKLIDRDRDYLREWLPWVDPTRSEDDTAAFVRRSLEQFASNQGFAAGIWEHGRLCGVIGMQPIDWMGRTVEIGYWLGREFQGRGLVTECCRALVKHALIELGLNRVEIRCAVENTRSSAVPKRLGFTLEGVLRERAQLHGRSFDVEVYSFLRRELR